MGNYNMKFDTKTYYIKLNMADKYAIDYNNIDGEFYTRTINFYD